jgi:agmatinase
MLLHFADANYDFESSFFVIFGVPYDGTSSFRHGSKFAPDEIRKASYNLESYILEHNISLSNLSICDIGNIGTLDEFGNAGEVINSVYSQMQEILPEKFPIMLGGEHSITIGAARAIKNLNAGIIFIDAHGDFRNEYLGNPYNHACTARRSYEELKGKIISIGVRSASQEEVEDARNMGYQWIDAYEFKRIGWKKAIERAIDTLGVDKIYLSLDIDGIDPAYAPGTGTPEFFGLSPMDIKNIIDFLAPYLIGADITEVCPPYDNGNTAVLASRLVQEIIAAKWNFMEDKFK